MKNAQDAAVISDHWGRRSSEIRVKHPTGTDSFPYDDSSQRRDQLRNARSFAQRMQFEGKVFRIADASDEPTMPRSRTKPRK